MHVATLLKKPTGVTSSPTSKQLHKQGVFLNRLGRLHEDGFSLKEALTFLQTIADKDTKEMVHFLIIESAKGSEFSSVLKEAGFPDYTCTQVYFSLFHGQFAHSLINAGDLLIKQSEKKKKMKQILQYPIMLVVFIIGMLIAMRYILIPHMNQIVQVDSQSLPFSTHVIVQSVYHAPTIIVLTLVICSILYFIVSSYLRRQSPIEQLMLKSKWSRSLLFQLYWSHYFTYEWGNLLKGNRSLFEVVQIMKETETSLLINEMGQWIEKEMRKGMDFHDALRPLTFLRPEVLEVVKHGELSGKLGTELILYAQNCEESFDKRSEQLMEYVQPVIFVGVAVIIIAIYAALLLPTFSLLNTL